jgi:hypothetical protein
VPEVSAQLVLLQQLQSMAVVVRYEGKDAGQQVRAACIGRANGPSYDVVAASWGSGRSCSAGSALRCRAVMQGDSRVCKCRTFQFSISATGFFSRLLPPSAAMVLERASTELDLSVGQRFAD